MHFLRHLRIGEWCEKISSYLNDNYPPSNNPKLGELLSDAGIISFKRKMVDKNLIRFELDDANNALMAEVLVDKRKDDLIEAMLSRGLEIDPVFLVHHTKCSKCKQEYMECLCLKYFDNQIHQHIDNAHMVGSFWTNRKA